MSVKNNWLGSSLLKTVFLTLYLAGSALAQDSCPVVLEKNGVIRNLDLVNNPTSFNGKIDLGELHPETSYRAIVRLKNATLKEIPFDTIKTSCSCAKVSVAELVLSDKTPTQLVVEFRTPKSHSNNSFVFSTAFSHNDKDSGVVFYKGELLNNLHLPRQALLKVGNSVDSVSIPLTITRPIESKSLRVTIDKSLGDIQASIKDTTNGVILEVLGTKSSFLGDFATGNITVKDESSGKKTETSLVVTRKIPVSVSPRIARFRKTESVKGAYTANLLVQFDKKQFPELRQIAPKFHIEIDNEKINVGVVRLSKTIFKITPSIDFAMMEKINTLSDENSFATCKISIADQLLIQKIFIGE